MVIMIKVQNVNMFSKIEPTEFSSGLDVGCQKKREVKDDYKDFLLLLLLMGFFCLFVLCDPTEYRCHSLRWHTQGKG